MLGSFQQVEKQLKIWMHYVGIYDNTPSLNFVIPEGLRPAMYLAELKVFYVKDFQGFLTDVYID